MIIARSLRGVPSGGGGAAHVAFVTPRECRDGASGHHHVCHVVEVFPFNNSVTKKRMEPARGGGCDSHGWGRRSEIGCRRPPPRRLVLKRTCKPAVDSPPVSIHLP